MGRLRFTAHYFRLRLGLVLAIRKDTAKETVKKDITQLWRSSPEEREEREEKSRLWNEEYYLFTCVNSISHFYVRHTI